MRQDDLSVEQVHNVTSPVLSDNPWPGLAFYTEENQCLFFGREKETADLLRLFQRDTLTILFGRSGMGKTSLLRAGLIPKLRHDAFFPIILRIDYAEVALPPVEQVKALTLEAARSNGIDVDNLSACAPDATLWEFFHTVEFWGVRNDTLTPVLLFDQFEELFTLGCGQSRAEAFKMQLADLVENRVPQQVIDRISERGERLTIDSTTHQYRIVLSLREDFVSKLDSLLPIMPAIMRNRLALHPLESEHALGVILGAGSRWVTEEVAHSIVAAVEGRGKEASESAAGVFEIEPAYLSVMCHELFRRMQSLDLPAMTVDLVASEQGNILEDLYERSFKGLSIQTRLFVEERLLTPSGFRATLPLEEAKREGVSLSELGILVDRRLLRFEDRLRTRHVELSHDLLTPVVQKRRNERRESLAQALEHKRQTVLRRQLVRSRFYIAIALGLVATLLGTGLFFYDKFFREHVSYYKSASKHFGMPVGIGEISLDTVKHRFHSIKIVRKAGKVLRMENITPEGRLHALSDDPLNYFKPGFSVESLSINEDEENFSEKGQCWEFVYGSDGREDPVIYEIVKDRVGRMVKGMVYAPEDVSRKVDGQSVKAMYVGAEGYPQGQAKSQAEYVSITYGASGEEREIRYTDREGKPMPGTDRTFGFRMSYDAQGRLVRKTSLGHDGKPAADAKGVTTTAYFYDGRDNLVRITFLDGNDRQTLDNVRGIAEATMQYDEWGNPSEIAYFNGYGRPAVDGATQVHVIRMKFDDPYHCALDCFDTDNQPVACGYPDVVEVKPIVFELNDDMNIIKCSLYTNNQSVPWAQIQSHYDESGFVQEQASFNEKNEPISALDGGVVHRVVTGRDSQHLPVEERAYDSANEPVAVEGVHLLRRVFNKQGKVVEVSWFGRKDEPCEHSSSGVHKEIRQYDNFGNETLMEFYDIHGNRTVDSSGAHQKRYEYDIYGNKVHARFYNSKEEPVAAGPNAVHYTTWLYDVHGNTIAEEYFGIHGEPVENARGIHRIAMAYNEKNLEIRKQYFGINNRPASDDAGVHLSTKVFNPHGFLIEETRLGSKGEAMYDNELGIATRRYIFDEKGRNVEDSFFDTNDHLAISRYGYAKHICSYTGNIHERTNIGPDGKPMFNPISGYVSGRFDDSQHGTVISASAHGQDGALRLGGGNFAAQERTFDDKGRIIVIRYLGSVREPVPGPGYYRIEIQYGPDGKAENKMFDVSGKEITAEELSSFPQVVWVSLEVTEDNPYGAKSPAAKAGMQTGDILWRYGDWSFPAAIAVEREKGTAEDKLLGEACGAMFSERDKKSSEDVPVWVIRHGKPISLIMPPLPEKKMGTFLEYRPVPPDVFEAWRMAAEQAFVKERINADNKKLMSTPIEMSLPFKNGGR